MKKKRRAKRQRSSGIKHATDPRPQGATFTPGPWEIHEGDHYKIEIHSPALPQRGNALARVFGDSDAKVMAAGPELIDAVIDWLWTMDADGYQCTCGPQSSQAPDVCPWHRAAAALKKAGVRLPRGMKRLPVTHEIPF